MAIVHSYIRMSTKKQLDGDSYRRQYEDHARWIEDNGHTLSSLSLHDIGVSGFRGKNRDTGKLGLFLASIGTRVQPGSILLLENLDRLSRQGVSEAQPLFQSILKAGVDIMVLKPYPMLFSRESLKDFIGLMIPLIYFHLAYIESKNKSDRISASWKHKRETIKDKPIDKFGPSWLTWDPSIKNWTINEGAKAISYIFQRTSEGVGQKKLTAELQQKFPPIGRSGTWNGQYVAKILSDRSVLGERQHFKFTEDGERHPIGKPVLNYYPGVIEESTWHRAQAGKATRRKQTGPSSDHVNLFTGLMINAHDGHPMHSSRSQQETGKIHRRLTSYAHHRSLPGADPVSVNYDTFEYLFLTHIKEIKASDLEPKIDHTILRSKEQELRGIEQRLLELQQALATPGKGSVRALMEAVQLTESSQQATRMEVEKIRSEITSDVPLAEAQSITISLATTPPHELHDARMRLRTLIAELVDKIYLLPEKHYGRVFCEIEIHYRSGLIRQYHIGPAVKDGLVYGATWDGRAKNGGDIDKLEMANKSKTRLKQFAEMWLDIPDSTDNQPVKTPDKLQAAATVWLKLQKAKSTKESYKTIPSKVNRLLDVVGDMPCREFNSRHWQLWIRSLRMSVAEGALASTSAKVTHNKSREFILWLIEEGKVKPIEALKISAEKAIATF